MKEFIIKHFIGILLFMTLGVSVNAKDQNHINDLSFSYGNSSEHIELYKLSIKKDLNNFFFDKKYEYLPIYYETSLGHWSGQNSGNINTLSFTPIFRYDFSQYKKVIPYVEAGVGATYISKIKIENENLGIHFQFENILGVGLKFDNIDLSLRYMHYSNANLSQRNSGIDFSVISISSTF